MLTMTRTPSPDSKRVLVAFRISESQAAQIDAARGALSRAAWAQGLVARACERMLAQARQDVQDKAQQSLARAVAVIATSAAPGLELDAPCPHPSQSVTDGVCQLCGGDVWD